MKTCLLFAVLFASCTALEAQEKLRVCLVSGSFEYDSDKSFAILQPHLEKKGMTCSKAFAKNEKDLPGLENLDTCDVAVIFTRRLKIDGDQLDRIKKYCQSGKPLVGIRTASHGFQNWLELDALIWGGNYKNHYKDGPLCEIKIEKKHPILEGFTPFASKGSLYRNTGHAKDIDVLLTGSIPEHQEPIAWTREVNGGRVFYTSLGHQKDFEEASFLRLLENAIRWTAKK